MSAENIRDTPMCVHYSVVDLIDVTGILSISSNTTYTQSHYAFRLSKRHIFVFGDLKYFSIVRDMVRYAHCSHTHENEQPTPFYNRKGQRNG